MKVAVAGLARLWRHGRNDKNSGDNRRGLFISVDKRGASMCAAIIKR